MHISLNIARRTLLVSLLLAGCSTTPESRVVNQYTIEQFLDTESIAGGSFSPDEQTILYSSNASGVYNAYTVPTAGGAPTQLTDSTETTRAISFFPSDNRVLLSADKGGNEIYHIYLREEDGTIRDLTPGETNRALFRGWAHDLNSFFYQSNDRDPRFMDLYEMEIDTLEPHLVYRKENGDSIGSVSNDKRYLTLAKVHTMDDNDLYLYDLETNEIRQLSSNEDEANVYDVDFTPDNHSLYYVTNLDSDFDYLARMELASGESQIIDQPDWDIMFAGLSWNGRYLVTAINEDARTRVKITDTATGQPVSMPELPQGDITGVAFSRSEERLRFYHSGPRSPANLHFYDLTSKKHTQLTNTLSPEIDPEDLVDVEVVRYKSFDGLEIPAILMKPHLDEGEKAPALVQVHGGPGGQSRVGYSDIYQYLANHGYVILRVNNRGSSGYGKTFFQLDDHNHGEGDLMDCVQAKEYLISTGFVDPDRIGIIGGSYGGYMVLAALAFQPEVFDIGVDIFGVANWARTLSNMPPWWTFQRDALLKEMGNPETEEDYLREISPLFHADQITKPLIVLQGANDPRVLQVESDEIVAAVRGNGVPVEYVVFDDEGHGFTKKQNVIEGYSAVLGFLDTHLKGNIVAE